MPPEDKVSLQVALINLALKCYSDRIDFVDKVLQTTIDIFAKLKIEKYNFSTIFFPLSIPIDFNVLKSFFRVGYKSAVSRELCCLMKLPVDYFNNILTILELKHYASLMECFDYKGRKTLALYLVNNVLNTCTFIPTQELVCIIDCFL